MLQRKFSRWVFGMAICAASFALLAGATAASAADGQAATGRVVKKIFRGRLPSHYADVVTEKQREEIYKIQEEYKPKIDAIKAQLEALTKEQNEKISAILTAEQKKKIEDAAAAAKAKAAKDAPTPTPAKPADNTEKKAEK